jgi:hypothetical protein
MLVIFTDVKGHDRAVNPDLVAQVYPAESDPPLFKEHAGSVVIVTTRGEYVRVPGLTVEQVAIELDRAEVSVGPVRARTATELAAFAKTAPTADRLALLRSTGAGLAAAVGSLTETPSSLAWSALVGRSLRAVEQAFELLRAGGGDEEAERCGTCADSPVPGALIAPPPGSTVERCDECGVFEGDLDAALAVAGELGGKVKFERSDGEIVPWFRGAVLPEGMHIAEGTDPWVEGGEDA